MASTDPSRRSMTHTHTHTPLAPKILQMKKADDSSPHRLGLKVAFTLLQGRLPVSTFTCSMTGVDMKVGVMPSTSQVETVCTT